MRSLKRAALLAVTSAVAMALMGSASASATKYTVLCKKAETPCGAGNVENGVYIVGKSTNFVIKYKWFGVPSEVKCEEAEIAETATLAEKGNPLEGVIAWVSFKECKTGGGTKCSTGTFGLNWKFLLEYKPGGGWFTITEKSSGVPGMWVDCGAVVKCDLYVSEEDESLPGPIGLLEATSGETNAQIHVNGIVMEVTECTMGVSNVEIHATYVLSQPQPFWISYVE